MAYSDTEFKFKKLGKNVYIGKNVYFRYPELSVIGDNVIIDEFCFFSVPVHLGSYIHIAPHCSVIGGADGQFIMEDFSSCSAGGRIVCSSDDYLGSGIINPTIPKEFRADVTIGKVILKKHSCLGTACVVHPNVVIGEGAVTGSMTLITKSLEPWGVYVGIPAKRVKDRPMEKSLDNERKLREQLYKDSLVISGNSNVH